MIKKQLKRSAQMSKTVLQLLEQALLDQKQQPPSKASIKIILLFT